MDHIKHPSVVRLLASLRKSGEFPAMARTVGLISSLTASEATSSSSLADTILQDYGLTQKVLRLVNTVSYAQYDEVTTITRAVLLMGFERIRGVATSLILFEHLQKQARTGALVDALNMSFYSAILGRNIAESSGIADAEEAFMSPGASAAGLADASSSGALVSEPAADDGAGGPAGELPETILTKGLHEITSLLAGEYTLDDVLKVALETIYRALGVGRTRVFFLLKDPAQPVARFRFGFGQTASDLKPWFEVPIRGAEDLISLAVTHQKDVVIRDATASEVVRALPDWFTARGVSDRYIVLLPLVVDQRAVGLFYVDGEREGLAALTPAVINYLKVLRGQAVLAIRQKVTRTPGRR
jgi:hypothetical protein